MLPPAPASNSLPGRDAPRRPDFFGLFGRLFLRFLCFSASEHFHFHLFLATSPFGVDIAHAQ
jgi:hypothetical protein